MQQNTIDREIEDAQIIEYQTTNDPALLDIIVQNRIPTLIEWSRRYWANWFDIGLDDLQQELTIPLIKAINSYRPTYQSFNTFLYRCLQNYLNNMISARFAVKRKHNGTLPLNAELGSETPETYLDYIVSPRSTIAEQTAVNERIDILVDMLNIHNTKEEEQEVRAWLYSMAYGARRESNRRLARKLGAIYKRAGGKLQFAQSLKEYFDKK